MSAPNETRPTDPVHTIMVWPVETIPAGAELRDVARALAAEHVGALVVTDDDAPIGIVSERDIVRALAEEGDPDEVWSADVMTLQTVEARPSESIGQVARRMLDAGVRHIPVREGDDIVGIVSIRDVLRTLLDQLP